MVASLLFIAPFAFTIIESVPGWVASGDCFAGKAVHCDRGFRRETIPLAMTRGRAIQNEMITES